MIENLALALLIILLIQISFFIFAAIFKTDIFTDLAYGLTFVAVVVLFLILNGSYSGVVLVVTYLFAIWGIRLAAFLFLLRYKNKRKRKWLFLCGFFTGLALIVRPDASLFMLVIVAGVFIVLYGDYRKGNSDLWIMAKGGIVFLAPILFFIAVYAYYNYARFGNIFELGYATKQQQIDELKLQNSPNKPGLIPGTLLGFAGMWIIPCRSMFFINPVLIFIFWAVKDFWRKSSPSGKAC